MGGAYHRPPQSHSCRISRNNVCVGPFGRCVSYANSRSLCSLYRLVQPKVLNGKAYHVFGPTTARHPAHHRRRPREQRRQNIHHSLTSRLHTSAQDNCKRVARSGTYYHKTEYCHQAVTIIPIRGQSEDIYHTKREQEVTPDIRSSN